GAHRVGVVSPALVAGDVALVGPALAAVEGLVEAEDVVVALRTDEPLRGADQVVRVGRVDDDVRLRMALDQHRRGGREAGCAAGLGRIGTQVLAGGGGSVAGRLAAVPLGRLDERVRHLRRVAAGRLGGGFHVRDVVQLEAPGEGRVRL